MTDNQIIKALERCPQHTECCYCNSLEECGNKRILIESVFDLINRQKAIIEKSEKVEHFADKTIETANAEIERLEKELMKCKLEKEMLYQTVKEIKSETIKECLTKVKNHIKTHCNPYGKPDFDYDTSIKILNFIDNFAKEMAGDDNA